MNTFQLWYALSTNELTRPHFSGVYARDTIPSSIAVGDIMVCNTDDLSKAGEHWVAWYRRNEEEYDFFDSLGASPYKYWPTRVVDYKRVACLPIRLQAPGTDICGEMCLFYAYATLKGSCLTDMPFAIPYEQTLVEIVKDLFNIPNTRLPVNKDNNQICKCQL